MLWLTAPVGEIILIRHGETAWSATGRHTSRTDLPLTPRGEDQARALGTALAGHTFAAVFASPRLRARRTAELAGLAVTAIDDDLAEWDYGQYEGITTDEIRESRPDWNIWRDGCPGGETPDQVAARLDRVLARIRPVLAGGDVALVAHGHSLRVAAARWVGCPVGTGAVVLHPITGTLSALTFEHDQPVIGYWNAPVGNPPR